MKAQRLVLVTTVILLTAFLVTSPAAAGGGVIQFRGMFSDYVEGQEAYPTQPLPGGRWVMHNPDGFWVLYAVEAKNGPDYVSGWHHMMADGVLQPGGTLQFWGTWETEAQDIQGSEGWWAGTYRANIQVRDGSWGIMQSSLQGTGQGALDGWTITMHVRWKDGPATSSVSGHMTPPKGWSE